MTTTVDGLTKDRMLAIEAASIVNGSVDANGHLILTRHDGTTIDAGLVKGPAGPTSPQWAIGSIYFTTTATNPGATLGGTWVAWGSGRVPVGVDTAQTEFATVELTGGSKTVTLTTVNLPAHAHTITHDHGNTNISMRYTATCATTGTGIRVTDVAAQSGGGGSTGTIVVNVPSYSGNSGNGPGTSTPINVLSPYITCYMWKRTA